MACKILFWGTPDYAVPTLNALVSAGHTVVGIVTQPDRRRGRGGTLQPSPVKARAQELGVPVLTPTRIRREPEIQAALASLQADVFVVVAFGQILPPSVLKQPPLGCWNGHGSLLPRWRGAGPIQWCLLEGDQETGVGIMAMEEGLDTGPVLLERRLPIALLDNAQQLSKRLAEMTGELFIEALPLIEKAGPGPDKQRLQRLQVRPQAESGISYARLLRKEDFAIDWNQSALSIHRRVMGLYPGAHTHWNGQRLKLLATEPLVERLRSKISPEASSLCNRWISGEHGPGTILAVDRTLGLVVATAGCPILIHQAQLAGKTAASGESLVQQLNPKQGQRLGSN